MTGESLAAAEKLAPWVATRIDGGMTYIGTEKEMRARIAADMKSNPLKQWLLARGVSVFAAEVLPPVETACPT